ncbi:MAG: sulfatase [Acidobacteria bacterium]|nr:sulfatase [Acidobacteriota bacterium]
MPTRTGNALRCVLAWLAGAAAGGLAAGALVGARLAFSGNGMPPGAAPGPLVVAAAAAAYGLAALVAALALVPLAALAAALPRPASRAAALLPTIAALLGVVLLFWAGVHRAAKVIPTGGAGLAGGAALAALLAALLVLAGPARRLASAAAPLFVLAGAPLLLLGTIRWAWNGTDAPAGLEQATIAAAAPRGGGGGEPPAAPPAFAPPRNVLLVVIDTLRADHLSCYGYPRRTSPTIDQLAAEGAVFEQALVQKTNTSPSVATILSGTYPYTHGLMTVRAWLPDGVLTLPEMLRGRYRTAGLVTNINLSRAFNFQQGFDDYVEIGTLSGPSDARHATDAMLKWLDAHGDQPFFAYLHYLDPHAPYAPPAPYRGRFEHDEHASRHDGPGPPVGGTHLGEIHRYAYIENSRDIDLYVARYDEEISYVDAELGRVLAALRAKGLDRDTLLLLTSDHGESLGEHEVYFGHGQVPFEDEARVPLVLRYPPGIAAGRRVPAPVETVSIAPTILDALRLPHPVRFEGRSLWPLLAGAGEDAPRPAFIEVGKTPATLMNAIRTGRWKLIRNLGGVDLGRDTLRAEMLLEPKELRRLWRAAHDGPGVPREWELYDLREDPRELRDLARERPEIARELWDRLAAWLAAAPPGRVSRRIDLDDLSPEAVEQLRSLGYVR